MLFDQVESFRLDNGMEVVYVPTALPLTTIALTVRAGSAHEPRDLCKISSLTMYGMFNAATDEFPRREAESRGILLCGTCGSVAAKYTTQGQNVDDMLRILSQMIQRPVFDPEYIEASRSTLHQQFARRRVSPGRHARNVMSGLLYRGRLAESDFQMSPMQRSDVFDFWSSRYSPSVATLVVSTAMGCDQLRSKVETHFAHWTQGARDVVIDSSLRTSGARFKGTLAADLNSAEVLLEAVRPTEGLYDTSPHDSALRVAMAILGNGLASRYMEWNDITGACASINATSFYDSFGVHHTIGTTTDDVGLTLREVWKQVVGLANGDATQRELDRAVRFLTTSAMSQFAADPVGELSEVWLYADGQLITRPEAAFERVALADVTQCMQEILPHFRLAVVSGSDRVIGSATETVARLSDW